MTDPAAPAGRAVRRLHRRVLIGAAALFAVLVVGVAIGEALGWPFLAAPMQRWLAQTLDRRVSFSSEAVEPASDASDASASAAASPAPSSSRVSIRFLGGLRIRAAAIEIGAPAWSSAPYTIRARDASLRLGYADLWRAHRGEPLRIRALRAADLDVRVERRADGRASWQFGKTPQKEPSFQWPRFELLRVAHGKLALHDELLAADVDARFALDDGQSAKRPGATARFSFDAKGRYRDQPMAIGFESRGVLDVVTDRAARVAWPVRLDASVGNAGLRFQGTATDPLRLTALRGRFDVHGPSLAAIGDPLGITLPTTGPFRASGALAKQGDAWNAVVDQAIVGSSELSGAFVFDTGARVPLLAGRLQGRRLLLADLGPAVGTAPREAKAAHPRGRTLPDRPFDLPSLRAMNANVMIDVDELDLGSSIVEPLRPLRTHLVLVDGVLTLQNLDARTGLGTLAGDVRLDGRAPQALWTADLRWRDVHLERWLHQARKENDAPPYVTGRLNGSAKVTGKGASTAAILGSLRGDVRMQLVDASVSHLAVEAAGLDLAQALGVLAKGDDALPVDCAVADLAADDGVLKPRVMVLDTRDSTIWSEGSLSLAGETLDLRLLVSPKDFSPLALRTPVKVRGTFADPQVSIDQRPLVARVGAAALLSLVNPLAAVLPFFDTGNDDEAKRGSQTCAALSARISRQRREGR